MFTTMSTDLQKQYEHVDAYTMIQGLHEMFENQARVRGIISQKPYLHVSWQRVARSILM
jgi:hypothetical protein